MKNKYDRTYEIPSPSEYQSMCDEQIQRMQNESKRLDAVIAKVNTIIEATKIAHEQGMEKTTFFCLMEAMDQVLKAAKGTRDDADLPDDGRK